MSGLKLLTDFCVCVEQQCWRQTVFSIALQGGQGFQNEGEGDAAEKRKKSLEASHGAGSVVQMWTPHAPMLSKRAFFGAVALNGRIYALGGRRFSSSIEV